MVSAYAVRKLREAKKVSTKFEKRQVKVITHGVIDRPPDLMNWHRVNDFYDLTKGKNATLSVEKFCDQIIHSWLFIITSPNLQIGFDGFIVSSDHARRTHLYQVSADVVISLFRQAGEEYLTSSSSERNDDGDWVITSAVAEVRPLS